MPLERTDVTTQRDGTLLLVRYGIGLSRDEARRLVENIETELARAYTPDPEEKVAGRPDTGKGW